MERRSPEKKHLIRALGCCESPYFVFLGKPGRAADRQPGLRVLQLEQRIENEADESASHSAGRRREVRNSLALRNEASTLPLLAIQLNADRSNLTLRLLDRSGNGEALESAQCSLYSLYSFRLARSLIHPFGNDRDALRRVQGSLVGIHPEP